MSNNKNTDISLQDAANDALSIKDDNDIRQYNIPLAYPAMRRSGALTARVLDYITPYVQEGISTGELDRLCHDFIIANGATPAPLNYRGYPCATCISVNHVVCHGIPSAKRVLKQGDILNIDVTVKLDGWYGDSSRMFTIGKAARRAEKLIDVTYECLMRGISAVKPDAYLGDIGAVIQSYAHNHHFSVVDEYCGHGIGMSFHEPPNVLHVGDFGDGVQLKPGMIFTIEPMINMGKKDTRTLPDGWTVITRDRQLSAQFEHTIGVTENGVEIFTQSE